MFVEKYSSLMQTSAPTSASMQQPVAELQTKYGDLLETSKEKLAFLEKAVVDHHIYQENYQDFVNWLNMSTEKIEAASDFGGDKLSLQNKLEKFKARTFLLFLFNFVLIQYK